MHMMLNRKFKRRATEPKQATHRPDPGLPDLQPVMMDSLWPYPEARIALRDALHAFALKWYSGAIEPRSPAPAARP
jgi:hypothetical protein